MVLNCWHKLAFMLLVTSVAIVLPGCQAPNSPPVIHKLEAAKGIVQFSTSIEIKCMASDPDGDTIDYSWSADAGTFDGVGNNITWTAPEKTGNMQ
ncbi:hypothetical protein ACFLXC_01300 [Chloroflexota bacterium]